MNKILFPGSFDPFHIGHLHMAELASKKYDADVILLPAVISVWKSESVSFEHKVRMVELSIKDKPRFSVSRYESTLDSEINYTINTIRHFVKEYPKDKFFLLIGEDQVNEFHRWREADEIARLVQIIYYSRSGYVENENVSRFHMEMVEGDEIDASSTKIRNMKGLEYLNRDVLRYIEDHQLYYFNIIKKHIGEKRIKHSISVANLAYDIALNNHLKEPIKAYIAGLAHDIGKEIPLEEARSMMVEHFKDYSDLPKFAYHQFLGTIITKNEFGIVDEEILDAIMFHATGKANMSPLGKIIYASDKIEPTRGFDSSGLIKSCMDNYEQGFIEVLKANKEYLIMKKGPMVIENTLTLECFEFYLGK